MTLCGRFLIAAVAFFIGACVPLQAQNLTIGDPAPKLDVSSFVKGEPISSLEAGKLYVVEFWATWCGPCRVTIPHLTELQKKHPEVNLIGVSVWEQDQSEVKPFVEKMGDKMNYRVAMDRVGKDEDGNQGPMAKNWMRAAGQDGIPTAFIINKESKVAWIGHPGRMDEPLEKIASGSWDLQIAATEYKKAMEDRVKMMKIQSKLGEAYKGDDPKKVLEAIDEAIAAIPQSEISLGGRKIAALGRLGETDKALEYGKHLTQKVLGSNPQAFNFVAWSLVDPAIKIKHDPKVIQFAVETAEQGDRLANGKDAAIADTLARAYFVAGKPEKSLETQERAVSLAKGTPMEQDRGLKARLEEYKTAAGK